MYDSWMRLAAIFFLFLVPTTCLAETLEDRVARVVDGDTIRILIPAKHQIKVRLAEIDTPETGAAGAGAPGSGGGKGAVGAAGGSEDGVLGVAEKEPWAFAVKWQVSRICSV